MIPSCSNLLFFSASSASDLVAVENYVKWQLAVPYLPLLSSGFREAVESFYESIGVKGGTNDSN